MLLISCGSDAPPLVAADLDASAAERTSNEAASDARQEERSTPPLLSPDRPAPFDAPAETALPDAVVGHAYIQLIAVRRGTGAPPFSWKVTGPDIPGIAANVATPDDNGNSYIDIAGVPQSLGLGKLSVELSDAARKTLSATYAFRVLGAPAAIKDMTMPHARAGVGGYRAQFEAEGGTPPFVWSAVGLPAGLTMTPETGEISGVPDPATGDLSFDVSVFATDSVRDVSTGAPAGRTTSITTRLHVDPGYRANIYPLLVAGCHACHGVFGNSTLFPPLISGIPTPAAGQENASGLVQRHPTGVAGEGLPSMCSPSTTYIVPGDPEDSLLFQKISATKTAPPPCGSCMPYQSGACFDEPFVKPERRELIRDWILSLPEGPKALDLE